MARNALQWTISHRGWSVRTTDRLREKGRMGAAGLPPL